MLTIASDWCGTVTRTTRTAAAAGSSAARLSARARIGRRRASSACRRDGFSRRGTSVAARR